MLSGHLREDLLRFLGLLDHVHGILEADHREERDRRRDGDGQEPALLVGVVEHHQIGDVTFGATTSHGNESDGDDNGERCHLDDRQDDIELHRFADAAQVDRRQQHHESEGDH